MKSRDFRAVLRARPFCPFSFTTVSTAPAPVASSGPRPVEAAAPAATTSPFAAANEQAA